jgi:SpoVK/Ycf46/Vps4 family AAA+-type ATPase
MALGKGLSALFAGESGTGKTMAADIMAGVLGQDLYKIDLSMLVSKYIGETEKNLNRIFTEAETSNAILFFDEADAIFGKRSEVKDSHDRYANIEISYLLQRMETYDGVVILASNLRGNLDEAFTRRLHFIIEFPFPEAADREFIWQVNFPSETPVADDIDYTLLARRFRLAGGNIRNIIMAAAFLAADEGQVVGMKQLLHASRREYQKIGRLIDESLFVLDEY